MKPRMLLALGVVGISAALLIGVFAMNTRGAGYSMMGRYGASSGPTISMDNAQQSVEAFLERTGNKDLRIDELMEFDRNFYALIKEKSSGIGAFELLINKSTGAVGFEPGPDMMWNTKYSVGGSTGMMGGTGSLGVRASNGAMTVTSDRATQIAQAWLDRQVGGNSAGTGDALYGYYTFHYQKAGKFDGMLSVNGFSGQVWSHSWHGRFIQAREAGA